MQTDRQTVQQEKHTARSSGAAPLIYGDTTVRLGGTIRPAQRGPTGADHLPHHIFDAQLREVSAILYTVFTRVPAQFNVNWRGSQSQARTAPQPVRRPTPQADAGAEADALRSCLISWISSRLPA